VKEEHATVWLALDLRKAEWAPLSPDDYREFWGRNVHQLVNFELSLHQVVPLRDRQVGEFTLQVTQLPKSFEHVTPSTPFAIHSVLERRQVNFACRCCEKNDVQRHAPLACATCAESSGGAAPVAPSEGASPRVCEAHAVILEGALRAFCPAHAPRCECGATAAGFCFGPACKEHSGVAFCEPHLRPHPNVPSVYFCIACYEALFPPCLSAGCPSVATIRCSHWLDTQTACGKSFCAEHALRWQVYGPEGVGLARCEEHGDLRTLTNEGLIFQLAASALVEQRNRLPSLQTVTHILMRPRGHRYALAEVNQLFADVRARRDVSQPFEARMIALIDSHEASRQEDLQRDEDEKALGRPFFEELKNELRRRNLRELADGIIFADFRPQQNCLYIRPGERLRGRLREAGSERIQELSPIIGARILFELEAR
jgi:hypothetical protein